MVDREITRQEVEPLLRDSPLRERIDYLLNNQELGSRPLTKLNGYGNIYPNCFGTALHVLGVERKFLRKLEHKGATNGVVVSRSGKGGFAVFPQNFDRPGSLQDSNMKSFFRDMCQKIEGLEHGDITYEEGYCGDGDSDYHHSMLFLGFLEEMKFFFEQKGRGGRFGFKSLAQFDAVPAISPEELKKDSLDALDRHFWNYGEVSLREFYRLRT